MNRSLPPTSDLGHKLETAVLIHLLRAGLEPAYMKTPSGFEVDFCVKDYEGRLTLIQVVADLGATEVRQREVRALLETESMYPSARRQIVTLAPTPSTDFPPSIEVHRASSWLLSQFVEG